MGKVYKQLINGIQKYFKKSGLSRAVVGVSGSIDSSLTLKFGIDALGADRITAISMPETGISSQENLGHAKQLCAVPGTIFSVSRSKKAPLSRLKFLKI